MKKLFLISALIFVSITLNAQVSVDPDTKLITYQEVVTMEGTKDVLYSRAIAWINSYFKNPQGVTTKRDPENGEILCAYRFWMKDADKDGNLVNSTTMVEFKFRLELKEGRYRYTFNQFRKKAASMFHLERWLDKSDPQYTPKCDGYLLQVDENIKEIIASLKKGMEPKAVKKDDW